MICFLNGRNVTMDLVAKAMGMMPGATGQMVPPVDPNARWPADCRVLFGLQLKT